MTAAYAADQQVAHLDPTGLPVVVYIWVAGLSILGWAASSLPLLAGWNGGNAETKLKILQGILVALLAGLLAFFSGKLVPLPDLLTFISVAGAGYLGDRYVSPRITNVLKKSDQ